MTYIVFHISSAAISLPEDACSQVKGGFSYVKNRIDSGLHINKLFRISHRKFETFYTETD